MSEFKRIDITGIHDHFRDEDLLDSVLHHTLINRDGPDLKGLVELKFSEASSHENREQQRSPAQNMTDQQVYQCIVISSKYGPELTIFGHVLFNLMKVLTLGAILFSVIGLRTSIYFAKIMEVCCDKTKTNMESKNTICKHDTL